MITEIGADLPHTMKRVASVLKRDQIPFALTGSFAVYARAGTSSEHDVDFLIKEEDVDRVLDALGSEGFRTVRPPEDWLVKAYDGDLLVDLIFRPVENPVTDRTLADSTVIQVNALSAPVLSASALMEHKLLSFSQHHCDMAKAIPLARSLREQIDWERVSATTKHSPYAQAFLYLIGLLDVAPATMTPAAATIGADDE